ncbi:MAG TPA: hypothetical protein VFI95_16070 [Terriglobales bacterium]|nr:hypothetical protein [Terriglobales bacterium]
MLVLVLAIGSFLVFVSVLACLLVAHTLEAREIARSRNIWNHSRLTLLSITQAFDPIYAPLWEAPIQALQLAGSTRSGIHALRLRPVFRQAASCFPEIYDGCEFVQWLEFLAHEDLIAWRGERVVITAKGKEFLANRFVTSALLQA